MTKYFISCCNNAIYYFKFKVIFLLGASLVCAAALAAKSLPQPIVLKSRNGILNVTLNVTVSRSTQGPFSFNKRSYNGQATGPTIIVKKGDILNIKLNNQLGTEKPTKIGQYYTSKIAKNKTGDWMHDRDVYSYPNFTNIHLHGLHVSPLGNSDNVFRQCSPQQSLTYQYKIPMDHPSGLFWYHPHFHGSSSLQLASGMAGAIIVEDDENGSNMPKMEEKVLIIHEVSHSNPTRFHTENIVCYFCMDNFMWPSGDRLPLQKVLDKKNFPRYSNCGGKNWPGTKLDFAQLTQPLDCTYILFNGIYQPEIYLEAGVFQRFRLVQSSHQSAIRFGFNDLLNHDCDIKILAMDGIYLNQPRNVTASLVVTAGSRVDFAIKCPIVGTFNLTSLRGGVHDSNMIHGSKTLYEPVLFPQLLAKLVVESSNSITAKPTDVLNMHDFNRQKVQLPNLLDKRVDRYYRVIYNLTAYGVEKSIIPKFIGQFLNGGQYSINGKSFTNRTEHCMVKNLVEEWTIVNAMNKLDRWMHSFHIHQNSFQIVNQTLGVSGQLIIENLAPGDYRDTVQVPVGGTVTFRIQATDYVGKFPFHCHVTAHQGIGMLQLVEVFDDKNSCLQYDSEKK